MHKNHDTKVHKGFLCGPHSDVQRPKELSSLQLEKTTFEQRAARQGGAATLGATGGATGLAAGTAVGAALGEPCLQLAPSLDMLLKGFVGLLQKMRLGFEGAVLSLPAQGQAKTKWKAAEALEPA